MDEFTRALAHGSAGLGKIEAGLDGDLGQAAQYAAIEELTAEPQRPAYRASPRPWGRSGYLRFRAVLIVFCILVLAAMILIR